MDRQLDGIVRTEIRPQPGLVTNAGSAFGTAIAITGFFALTLSQTAPRMGVWGIVCGALIVATGAFAVARPEHLRWARFAGASIAALVFGASIPAIANFVQYMASQPLPRPDFMFFDVLMGILAACYLAFVVTDMLRAGKARRAESGANSEMSMQST